MLSRIAGPGRNRRLGATSGNIGVDSASWRVDTRPYHGPHDRIGKLMRSAVCDKLGIEFPLLAFSHCRDVVVEVSKAGGMGVLGAVDVRSAEAFEAELKWIDD